MPKPKGKGLMMKGVQTHWDRSRPPAKRLRQEFKQRLIVNERKQYVHRNQDNADS
jgi:hypothetical protein